jgi:prophage DNA circulation protein
LYIARGSAGEVRSMLCVMERISAFENLKSEISNLKSLAEEIARQLRGWAQHLQDSPIRGQRYRTSKTRRVDQARRDRDEFLQELDAMKRKT